MAQLTLGMAQTGPREVLGCGHPTLARGARRCQGHGSNHGTARGAGTTPRTGPGSAGGQRPVSMGGCSPPRAPPLPTPGPHHPHFPTEAAGQGWCCPGDAKRQRQTVPRSRSRSGDRDVCHSSLSSLGVNAGKEIAWFLPNTNFYLDSGSFAAPPPARAGCRLAPFPPAHSTTVLSSLPAPPVPCWAFLPFVSRSRRAPARPAGALGLRHSIRRNLGRWLESPLPFPKVPSPGCPLQLSSHGVQQALGEPGPTGVPTTAPPRLGFWGQDPPGLAARTWVLTPASARSLRAHVLPPLTAPRHERRAGRGAQPCQAHTRRALRGLRAPPPAPARVGLQGRGMLRGSATRSARLQFMVLEGKAAARRGTRAQAREEGRGGRGLAGGAASVPSSSSSFSALS